jgi:hypothetical protein
MGQSFSHNVEMYYFLQIGFAIVLLLLMSFKNRFDNRLD